MPFSLPMHLRGMIPVRTLRMAAALLVAGAAAACQGDSSGEPRLGFTPQGFQEQARAEARFARGISADYISDVHLAITQRPHPAGSEGTREVVAFLRDELQRLGLEVEVPEYRAYLSAPVRTEAELVSPVRESFALMEPSDPRDPDSAHPEIEPAYIAYSASGEVTAPVVYVNYGLPPDYEALRAAGVDVRGRIVIARYGRSHRAVKVHTAQENGAVGVIFYSDPADDGFKRGEVWPEGMWRTEFMVQRGNAKFSWFWHGDPLTPGVASTPDNPFIAPEEAPTLPRIPVVAMSWGEAQRILERLSDSPVAPEAFQGGLPFEYHTGPGAVTMRINVELRDSFEPIYNVVGRIPGAAEPDRWVMIGTHHDAWTFGGVDPNSAAAVLLEIARGLTELRATGWQPARSIVFAFWDAEEFGLIGSTEYAEDREEELQEKAVLYLNSDMYSRGRLVAGGSPSLRDFVIELARDLPHEDGTLYDYWQETEWERASTATREAGRESFEVELNALGSGADFVAFQDYVGLPTLSLEFLFEGGWGFGSYHSTYDTRFYMAEVVDPGFEWGAKHARLLGTTLMRMASAPILPYRYSHYARHIRSFLEEAEQWALDDAGRPVVTVDTGRLREIVDRLEAQVVELEGVLDAQLAAGTVPGRAREINDHLMRLDQALLDGTDPAWERWYRHLVYGWNIYALYSGQPLPHLFEAIRVADQTRVADELGRLQAALERMLAGVDDALAATSS